MDQSSRRDFLKFMGMGALSMSIPGCSSFLSKSNSGQRPNFLFILVDDLGWRDLGCYGSDFYESPNIDALAKDGVKFTNAYAASPVCSPTRASILTGKYPARMNVTDWFTNRNEKKMLPADYLNYLPKKELTIAEALKASGYNTFYAGKWHLGSEAYYPENNGFEINKGGYKAGHPKKGYFSPYGNPKLTDGSPGEYLTDRLGDETISFLEQQGNDPFLLYLSFYSVHTPLMAKKEDVQYFKQKAKKMGLSQAYDKNHRVLEETDDDIIVERYKQSNPVYAAMIKSVDDNVGRVLGKLKALNLDQNTIVILMSDNGGLSITEGTPTSNAPLKAGKGWLYEGGIREPMLIRWPGVTTPGSVCNEPVTSTDFYPTMLEMAGLSAMPDQHRDGKSLVPLLKGDTTFKRGAIYWHYPHYSNQKGKPAAAVRLGNFKLIEYFEDNNVELFDLATDIGEATDLSEKMPGKTNELRSMLHRWYKEVDAKMMRPNPEWL